MKRTLASYSLSGYHSNTLILRCFIHLQYHLGLKLCLKWMVEDHSLDQLLFKSIGSTLFYIEAFGITKGDYVTFLRFLKQRRTLDLNNSLCILLILMQHNDPMISG